MSDIPELVVDRLKHYFLTYKDLPGNKANTEITHTYDIDEAHELILCSLEDYQNKFASLDKILSSAAS